MQHIENHTQKIAAMGPPDRKGWAFWGPKLRKTAIGLGSIVLGVGLEKYMPHLDDRVLYALLIFGGFMIAGDGVRALLGYVIAIGNELASVIEKIRKAIRG